MYTEFRPHCTKGIWKRKGQVENRKLNANKKKMKKIDTWQVLSQANITEIHGF